jgi:hypothetical protein
MFVTLSDMVTNFRRLEETNTTFQILKIKAELFFEMSGVGNTATRCNSPKDLKPQHERCVNHKSHIKYNSHVSLACNMPSSSSVALQVVPKTPSWPNIYLSNVCITKSRIRKW